MLYSFGTGSDGSVPVGGVSFDSAGNLYGTTSAGGAYGLRHGFSVGAGMPAGRKTFFTTFRMQTMELCLMRD